LSKQAVFEGLPVPTAVDQPFKLAYDQSYGFFNEITDYNWKLTQERA